MSVTCLVPWREEVRKSGEAILTLSSLISYAPSQSSLPAVSPNHAHGVSLGLLSEDKTPRVL